MRNKGRKLQPDPKPERKDVTEFQEAEIKREHPDLRRQRRGQDFL